MDLDVRPLSSMPTPTSGQRWHDDVGGAPLRCCLRDSRPGEEILTAQVSPPGPQGAYQETGPVFVHAEQCDGPERPGYPEDFRGRTQVFRAYSAAGRIVGGRVVAPDDDQEAVARELLAGDGVAFLHSRNLIYGCYMFAIHPHRRSTADQA